MRHLGNIAENDIAVNISADRKGQLTLRIAELRLLENLAQGDHILRVVRDLDAECRFALDLRDTHGGAAEIQPDIVCERGDLRDLDTGCGLDLIARDRGTSADARDAHGDAEALECIDQQLALFSELCGLVRIVAAVVGAFQQGKRRCDIGDLGLFVINAFVLCGSVVLCGIGAGGCTLLVRFLCGAGDDLIERRRVCCIHFRLLRGRGGCGLCCGSGSCRRRRSRFRSGG